MQPDATPIKDLPKCTKQGIGAQYNKYFGIDIDDGEDYTKFFKAIDEEADDGVFVAPDGSVHDLKKREITDVDRLVDKLGFDRDVFGSTIDPTLPKLVDDTDNLLANGIDPEVLAAMDDEDVDELDDDFFAKALALEDQEFDDDDDEGEVFDAKSGMKKSVAKSRVSYAPSHASHISHRSEAMDYVEEKVEHLLNTVYNEEEEPEEEEDDDDGKDEIDWDDVIDDFDKFKNPMAYMEKPPETDKTNRVNIQLPSDDEDNHKEEEEQKPKEKWDCESIIDTYSTTENRPGKVRDENIPIKKKQKKPKQQEEEPDNEIVPPNMQPKPNETKEEAKARKKAIKEYNKQRRIAKKQTKEKFKNATKRVKKSIAASGASRGQTIIPLD
ncbi:Low temperature viability protein [Tritrichomonas foetus]|uniref:Low temperature viability protein n=1 Tax=Tritrichomonas foetus TaxID=1144522 RepID=A0A1J4KHP2_9EUKA|nr:Low temperature viability protein [Tritrichomonas foetus]|eukprot:OHT10889.1 Low temperature viability protein [Tritrichomonas foetus]